MDPEYSLQDVVRCHLCDTPVPPLHCDICDVHLCKICNGKHLSGKAEVHKIVPINLRGSTIKCHKHSSKACERFCVECDIPLCVDCASSLEHLGHEDVNMLEKLKSNKSVLQRDLNELENSIHPINQQIALILSRQKTDLKRNSQILTIVIYKQGE